MKDITLRQVEYFLAVLEKGSVSAAADACRVSQATVSAALGQLEKQLGVTLLARGPARRAQPTTTGREFGFHAKAILASVAEAVESIDNEATVLQGALRVGCIPTAAPRILPGVAARFSADYPGVDVSVIEAHPMTIQHMVLRGEVDVAVLYTKQMQLEGLRQHRLGDLQLHALLSHDHPLAARAGVEIAELVDDPLILLDSPPTADLLLSQIRSLGHEPHVRLLSPSAETIRSMVAMGLGYSLANAVPHPDIRSFQGMRVAYRPVVDRVFANTLVGITMAEARMSKKLSTALDVLRSVADETDPANWDSSPR